MKKESWKTNKISFRILAVSFSFMGLILCTTLFMATVSPANANSNPVMSAAPAAENGRIMMDYTSVYVPTSDKTYYEVLVWDNVTGVSKLYYYDYADKVYKVYDDNAQLPANPLD